MYGDLEKDNLGPEARACGLHHLCERGFCYIEGVVFCNKSDGRCIDCKLMTRGPATATRLSIQRETSVVVQS